MAKLSLIAFLLAAAAAGFGPVRDTDFGWHYRCGKELIAYLSQPPPSHQSELLSSVVTSANQDKTSLNNRSQASTEEEVASPVDQSNRNEIILKEKAFSIEKNIPCTTNEFSYYLPNYRPAYPSFVFDAILAVVFDKFGFLGVSAVGAVIFVIAALAFYQLLAPILPIFRMASFFAVVYLSWQNVFFIGARAQNLTFAFLIILLLILKKAQGSRRLLAILPILFLIWANTHIGFFIGLVVMGMWVVVSEDGSKMFSKRGQTRRFVPTIIFSILATLLNPFGVRVYGEVLNHFILPLNQLIGEWVAPVGISQRLIIISIIIYIALTVKSRKINRYHAILLALFSYLGLSARRNLPLFYAVYFYILWQVPVATDWVESCGRRLEKDWQVGLTLLLLYASLLTAFFLNRDVFKLASDWQAYCHDNGLANYPCEAIKKLPEKGNVFAMYEWGGFLIWQKPKIKVFVDGRMPAWRAGGGRGEEQSPYAVWLEILQAQEGWNEKLKNWRTDYIFINRNTFLDLLLQEKAADFGWRRQWQGRGQVIYEKNHLQK